MSSASLAAIWPPNPSGVEAGANGGASRSEFLEALGVLLESLPPVASCFAQPRPLLSDRARDSGPKVRAADL